MNDGVRRAFELNIRDVSAYPNPFASLGTIYESEKETDTPSISDARAAAVGNDNANIRVEVANTASGIRAFLKLDDVVHWRTVPENGMVSFRRKGLRSNHFYEFEVALDDSFSESKSGSFRTQRRRCRGLPSIGALKLRDLSFDRCAVSVEVANVASAEPVYIRWSLSEGTPEVGIVERVAKNLAVITIPDLQPDELYEFDVSLDSGFLDPVHGYFRTLKRPFIRNVDVLDRGTTTARVVVDVGNSVPTTTVHFRQRGRPEGPKKRVSEGKAEILLKGLREGYLYHYEVLLNHEGVEAYDGSFKTRQPTIDEVEVDDVGARTAEVVISVAHAVPDTQVYMRLVDRQGRRQDDVMPVSEGRAVVELKGLRRGHRYIVEAALDTEFSSAFQRSFKTRVPLSIKLTLVALVVGVVLVVRSLNGDNSSDGGLVNPAMTVGGPATTTGQDAATTTEAGEEFEQESTDVAEPAGEGDLEFRELGRPALDVVAGSDCELDARDEWDVLKRWEAAVWIVLAAGLDDELREATLSTFGDVGSDPCWWRHVEVLAGRGIIEGYEGPEGKEFRPAESVTPGQVRTMLEGAFQIGDPSRLLDPMVVGSNGATRQEVTRQEMAVTLSHAMELGRPALDVVAGSDCELDARDEWDVLKRWEAAVWIVLAAGLDDELREATLATFGDVGSDPCWWRHVEVLAGRGIIEGYEGPEGKEFRPAESVTPGQVRTMLEGAFQIGDPSRLLDPMVVGSNGATRQEVTRQEMAVTLSHAMELGRPALDVVAGSDCELDARDEWDVLKRWEAAVWIVLAAGLDDELREATLATFGDVGSDPCWWRHVEVLAGRGIIEGYEGPEGKEFRPAESVTPGQVRTMLEGAFQIGDPSRLLDPMVVGSNGATRQEVTRQEMAVTLSHAMELDR